MNKKLTNLSSVHRVSQYSRKAGVLMAIAIAMPAATQVAYAGGYGGGSTSSIAQTEIARRAALVQESDKALTAGRKAYADQDYEEAVKQYQIALNLLPSGPAMADRRNSYTGHLGDASLALSQKYSRVGKYDEARSLLEGVLANDPGNLEVIKNLEYLDDPIRLNPALTYEHTQNVDKVRQSLYMAEGYYNLGKYDEAVAEYQKVLRTDKTNVAARRGMEQVNQTQSTYYRAAYDQTRAQLLMEVDRAWEMSVPTEALTLASTNINPTKGTGVQYLQQKLNTIILPSVSYDDASLDEVIDELRLRAREFDPELDERKKGMNIILAKKTVTDTGTGEETLDTSSSEDLSAKRITGISLTNVPLGVVLRYVSDQAGLKIKIDEYSVKLIPRGGADESELYRRSFVVPPDFIAKISTNSDSGGGATDDPFGSSSTGSLGESLNNQRKVQELLQANGVQFPGNATASYLAASNTLMVNNTLSNLEQIEAIISAIIGSGSNQVKITCKFIEISQNNTDELGFDWAVSSFGVGDSTVSGGAVGTGNAFEAADFSDTSNIGTSGQGLVTSGNRSGSYAISNNSVDSIINNPTRNEQVSTVAPGILSLTGVFGNRDVTAIMRGLDQKKGTDIMTAPSIIARSGEKATIKVIREFLYPTEYEPPELPDRVTSASSVLGTGDDSASSSVFPVTPATPTAFELKPIGVSLEIEPTIGENNYTIDLRFVPEIVEFEGFINYGSPIKASGLIDGEQIVITDNRIEMPVFAIRSVNTQLTIYDGYTVAIGGLMREDVQNVEDKVPLLGDLPIIGRLFQSKSENHIKSNLVIFVTAEIIDPAGMRINRAGASSGLSSVPTGGGLLPDLNL